MSHWLEVGSAAQGTVQRLPRSGGLRVRLPENPTTGYRWALVSCGTLETLSNSFAPGDAGVGAGGVRRFDLGPTTAGTQPVRFALRREWATDDTPADRLEFTVEVV
jgi:inhibitor of cysteine peptidase